RTAQTGDAELLLLHAHNADGQRAEVVPVTAPVATATTTTLAVGGSLREGGEQVLTATVTPAEATGSVRFLDGATELGTAPVEAGTATLTVTLPAGTHALQAVYLPDAAAWSGSTSEVVTVEVTARARSSITALVPRTVKQGSPAYVTTVVRSAGPT